MDKEKIRLWVKANKENSKSHKQCLQEELSKIDLLLDKGEGSSTLCRWIESPILVKDEFLSYFASLFNKPPDYRLHIDLDFPNKLSLEQQIVLEIEVTREEIKTAVWDCGVGKSPGPDGFTFGFYRRYWTFLENDVVEAVLYFFNNGQFPKGSISSFITLIPKTQEAKMMKDFRPITLIGSLYKIIVKILANRLVVVLEDLVSDVQSAFVTKWQILDGPFILNELFQWWDIDVVMVSSYDEWLEWLLSIRLHSKHKELFEGVCYVLWWYIWNFCNKSIFGSACPSKAI
ncbi:hypothetical protein Tco_0823049 [Tanacetum coccineum]|uniref:RNA-directed DNA polymerase, eukaryota, reverse transcriptase zinc-binding domain protein n=1 Tax=Tanacetum coccineum TaxID=301880 RepID=A0ABQ5AGT3_9ASTR